MVFIYAAAGIGLGAAVLYLARRLTRGSPAGRRGHHGRLAWLVVGGMTLFSVAAQGAIAHEPQQAMAMLSAALLLLLATVDAEIGYLPDIVIGSGFLLAAAAVVPDAGGYYTLPLALAGAVTGYLFFMALYWLGHRLFGVEAMGLGDVKLAALLGALLGLPRAVPAWLLGMIVAGLLAAGWLILRPDRRPRYLPLGACLALAGVVMLISGATLVERYLIWVTG